MARFPIKWAAFVDPRLRALAEYVEANPSVRLRLPDAARIANLSTKHFSAFFHERVGVTFSVWRQTICIENARRLLVNEGTLIKIVAPAVGFDNLDSFTRAFTRCEGVCPRRFKTTIRTDPELKALLRSSNAWPAATLFRLHAMKSRNSEVVSLLCRLASVLGSGRFN